MRKVWPKKVIFYVDQKGHEPFAKWLNNLKDPLGYKKIIARLRRLEQGNYGYCRSVGKGILELKINYGPGYRLYFVEKDDSIIILFSGGSKETQKEDIKIAQLYWKEYGSNA
ncbi:MAG: type II toxin-antitoxin system RelE/ParE family toxin [Candidatus Omnitrophica bacterium]|nr:type II toxin-antitoxin system RelE/ParE family toxin [Candidatus Omnitrophota bacterium]